MEHTVHDHVLEAWPSACSRGVHQELFVEKIEWGKNVFVKNGNGGPIKCYYQIWADRDMGEKLHVEYEGETPADYPGDQSMHSIAGYDYDRRQN